MNMDKQLTVLQLQADTFARLGDVTKARVLYEAAIARAMELGKDLVVPILQSRIKSLPERN